MNENNNETTFENAKVGDKVYDIRYGEGEIISIKESSEHPVGVGFPNIPYKIIYKFNGLEYRDHKNRILFWDKPQIIAPPRSKPVEMVKVAPYATLVKRQDNACELDTPTCLFASYTDAKKYLDCLYGEKLEILKIKRLADWEIEIPASEYKYGSK